MAGLSIIRRRKAWLRGVACGASGKGKCMLQVPKLKDIFQKGLMHGRANADTLYVKAVLDQEHRKRRPTREVRAPFRSPRTSPGRPRPRRPF